MASCFLIYLDWKLPVMSSDWGGNVAKYEICGTCTIHCDGVITKVRLFPAEGYLSPNKKWAVCYPNPFYCPNAKLHKLEDGFCVISAPNHGQLIIFAVA